MMSVFVLLLKYSIGICTSTKGLCHLYPENLNFQKVLNSLVAWKRKITAMHCGDFSSKFRVMFQGQAEEGEHRARTILSLSQKKRFTLTPPWKHVDNLLTFRFCRSAFDTEKRYEIAKQTDKSER